MKQIEYEGKQYNSLTELAIELKTSVSALKYRLKHPREGVLDHIGNRFNSIKELCAFWQISYTTYAFRLKSGWSLKKTLTTKTRDYVKSGKFTKVKENKED